MEESPQEFEEALLAAIVGSATAQLEAIRACAEVPAGFQLTLGESWAALAMDASRENWRRLCAYRMFARHVVSYPIPKHEFQEHVLKPLALDQVHPIDTTRLGGALPIMREGEERIYMLEVPVRTQVGGAALYFAQLEDWVTKVDVYPVTD